jgi:hypothetical protein
MVGALLIVVKIFREKIWKEKQLENGEHDDQFDNNQLPQGLAHGHAAEAIKVKTDDAGETEIFDHGWGPIVFREKTGRMHPAKYLLKALG